NKERERRKNIKDGFALLQEQFEGLLLTTYYNRKLSKADLLKKGDIFFYSYLQLFESILYTDLSSLLAASQMQSKKKRLTHLVKQVECLQTTYINLLAKLENIKMGNVKL
ncbi:13704_t:CDS:1, partial [Gigaspora margarita]